MLTIAGFDPSSGAGVTADLEVFRALGCFGVSCVTALTVQSTRGVRRVMAVDAGVVAETLTCLWEDLPAAGMKIGMLGNAGNVAAVAGFVRALREEGSRVPVVLDPVVRSSSGGELLSGDGLDAMRRDLLGVVDWVTPNRGELGALVGGEVSSADEVEAAVKRLQGEFPGLGVLATGGEPLSAGEGADDLAAPAGGEAVWLRGEWIESRATHGTGCAFSSALACGLADGMEPVDAARRAKKYVAEAIRRATPRGSGTGPMDLMWPFRR